MPKYRFLQLDVFTDHAFGGNPLAVFPEAEGITDDEMQQIAREMNLSETVFVLPSNEERALRRLRIFTPARELPFAGHPVVGTWYALALEGIVSLPEGGSGLVRIEHELGIGVLPVEIEFQNNEPVRVVMTQGQFEIVKEVADKDARGRIARAIGLSVDDLNERLPVQAISTGNSMLIVPVRSLEALGRCSVDAAGLVEAYRSASATGCYAFTFETKEDNAAHARFFVPDLGMMEDPATGSAAGPLGGYLVHHGALSIDPEYGVYRFVIEQGDFMNRPSRIHLEVTGTRGNVEQVRVAGSSVLVARGKLIF
ncbi:MAG TPA: PhzF family phenazine biosynthesis protein [Pyrinomonadaceae bacterium]|nr:PhzF family phenazine biosynthesis protein [Pyrinomonadaceae bacterium]